MATQRSSMPMAASSTPTTTSLISLFDAICASNGDSNAFVSAKNGVGEVELSSLSERHHCFSRTEVGFSELREASIATASELLHRHGVSQLKMAGNSTLSPCGVLVVSDRPSAGEAAAVLACTRLRVPFVPVDVVGPNRVGMKRLRSLLSDCDCKTAIVVVDASDSEIAEDQPAETAVDTDETDDDFLTAPAMQTTADSQLDQHPAVKLLERAGIYRHVMISSRDGTLLNGLGVSELELPEPIVEETIASLRDPLYVLCTSGSTSSGQGQQKSGKAVAQTHGGLLNRIQWQWETFPFVQQMRRDIGFAETNELLDADSLPSSARNDMVIRRTPLAFVDSICEIFATLLAGVPLYCPSSHVLRREGLAGILDEAEHVRATRITCLPSQLSQMLRIGNSKSTSWPWMSLNVAIVSGEPCPPSLPELWESTVSTSSSSSARPHKLLVNLYGQTESSADVLCAIVSKGRAGKSFNISRFPRALKYLVLSDNGSALSGGNLWSPARKDTQKTIDESLARSLRWTVPCGFPIRCHNVMVGLSQQRDDKFVKSTIGNLFVQGPGLALGYLNRQNENEKSFREINGEQWFDTGDLAYLDDGTGLVYILGRAGDDEGGKISKRGASCIGKINGVLVHTAEVEAIYSSALSEMIKRKEKSSEVREPLSDDGLNVVAVIHQVNPADSDDTLAACSHPTRLSVFVDASSMPACLLRQQEEALFGKSSSCTLIPPKDAFEPAYQSLLDEVKAQLNGNDDLNTTDIDGEFACHPALIPHRIHLVSRMPRSGAAGKIDRSELVRLSSLPSEVQGQCTENQVSAKCPILTMVLETFGEILGLDSSPHTGLSFSELGGDSMMAIECAHKINQELKKTKGIRVEHVSAIDVMELSMDKMRSLLLSGRKMGNTRGHEHAEKRDEKPTNAEHLESLGGVVHSSSACSDNAAGIHTNWKCRLLMCVDAKPLLVDNASRGNVVIVGSQGGDLLCCCSESGKVLQRKQLSGKVEGGMTAFQVDTRSDGNGNVARTFIFVCTYSDDGGPSGNGKIYALEFCKKRKFGDDQGQPISVRWERDVCGNLKGSPACFSIAEAHKGSLANAMRSGLLVGSYDGSLRYFDAVSGGLVAYLDDLGGAIHASPAIFCRNDGSKCALVASSTWTGRLSCIHLQHKVMTKLWYFDTWAPIYASPLICQKGREKERVAVFGAVDGAVRCVNLEAGTVESEVWKTSVGCGKPIFSGCVMIRKDNNEDGNSIIIGSHDGSVSCLAINDGSCIWRYKGIGSVVGTPAVVDDMVVALSTSGDVVCLDSNSGEVKKKLPESVDGEIFSNVATSNSSIFFGARDSHLYKIDL